MPDTDSPPLCLEKMGFPTLDSFGTDEIRPYTLRSSKLEESLERRSIRLPRLYQKDLSNLSIPPYKLADELDLLGSIEQPVDIDKETTAATSKSQGQGRGLLASCYAGKYVNATVRKSKKSGLRDYAATFDPTKLSAKNDSGLEYRFEPNADYSEFYHSVKDLCEALWTIIAPLEGLVVLAGGTGSGKSQIVRGIIHYFLETELERRKSLNDPAQKRVHLLTIENPIEDFLFLKTSETAAKGKKREAADPNDVATQVGIDYTPRQIPEDTPTLEQALMRDALRQTPTLTYVGEVREPHEFRTVLDFAETGQPIITTMHAGSLREAFQRLLSAAGAETPAARAQIASRIRAVIHVQPLQRTVRCRYTVQEKFKNESGVEEDVAVQKFSPLRISLPTVWVNKPTAVSNLVADGLSSLVAGLSGPETYCYGRASFLKPHPADRRADRPREDFRDWERVRQEAVSLDLGRGSRASDSMTKVSEHVH